TSFIATRRRRAPLLLLLLLGLLLLLRSGRRLFLAGLALRHRLALLDDLRLRRALLGRARRRRLRGRSNLLLRPRRDHVRDHHVGLGEDGDLGRSRDLGHAQVLADLEAEMSTTIFSGMSAGRHSTSSSRVTQSTMPPWTLTPTGVPVSSTCTLTCR